MKQFSVKLGRVTIPAKIRNRLGLTDGTLVDFAVTSDGRIVITPQRPKEAASKCELCGKPFDMAELIKMGAQGEVKICPSCTIVLVNHLKKKEAANEPDPV